MIKLCPKCGSGKIGTEVKAGVEVPDPKPAQCWDCGWLGTEANLIVAPDSAVERHVGVDWGVEGEDYTAVVALEVSKEYLRQLAKNAAQPIGLSIISVGLIGRQQQQEYLPRLLRAACLGAHKGTLEELENIQKEVADDKQPS